MKWSTAGRRRGEKGDIRGKKAKRDPGPNQRVARRWDRDPQIPSVGGLLSQGRQPNRRGACPLSSTREDKKYFPAADSEKDILGVRKGGGEWVGPYSNEQI